MSHYEQDIWESYIRGDLPDKFAVEIEDHLYQCDVCLFTYTTYLELHSSRLPSPLDGDALTNDILTTIFGPNIEQVEIETPSSNIEPVRIDHWRSLRNYLIAAAATIILMVTGVFNGLFEQVDGLQSRTAERETSVSEKLVDQTAIFLNDIHPKKP